MGGIPGKAIRIAEPIDEIGNNKQQEQEGVLRTDSNYINTYSKKRYRLVGIIWRFLSAA